MRTPGGLSHGDETQRDCAGGAEGFQGLLGVWKPQLPLLEHGWLYFGRTTCFQLHSLFEHLRCNLPFERISDEVFQCVMGISFWLPVWR